MAVPEGTDGGRAPIAGSEGLDRLMSEERAGVYYEVVEGIPVSALTRGELERSRGVALNAYAAGRASRNVPPRKQERYEFIHQLVRAGETDWRRVLNAVLQHNSEWGMKNGAIVKPKTLQNGYRLWLRRREEE
jgi:hypothetical protein